MMARHRPFSSLPLVALLFATVSGCAQTTNYDFVIAGARIVDGTGAAWFAGDVGIIGDRIAAIGDLHNAVAKKRIDAKGLVVSPGFIDTLGQSEFNLLVDNRAASKLTQGVTTEITGEGTSDAPLNGRVVDALDLKALAEQYHVALDWHSFDEFLRRLERAKPAINLGMFVGAGGLRSYVIGNDNRPATLAELEQMRQLVAQSMQQGALGLSSALQYLPDNYASTDEIVELAKVARRYGGVYFTHQRSEGDRIFPSLDEVFAISERANISTTIWHLKTMFPENWGKMPEVLKRIDAARTRGIDVAASVESYTRGENGLSTCFPPWILSDGTHKMLERLKDPVQRDRVKKEMNEPATDWENYWLGSGGGQGIQLIQAMHPELHKYEGMNFAEIGQKMGKDPTDAAIDFAIADEGLSEVVMATMSEDDVRAAVSNPLSTYGSDSAAQAEDGPLSTVKAHPRAFATFSRVLAQYVRTEHTMSLEEAIRKMTSFAASRVGIMDRGILRPGMMADIAVFDLSAVQEVSTYQDPLHYATGMKYVFVNGKPVVLDGKITGQRPGRALRGPGYKQAQ